MNLKNLRKTHGFKATHGMYRYAFYRAKLGEKASDTEVARHVGISREQVSRWRSRPEFEEWLALAVGQYRAPIHDLLECVAKERLIEDFRYWEAMAKKFGYISEQVVDNEDAKRKVVVPAITIEQAEQVLKDIVAEEYSGQDSIKDGCT